MTSTLTTTSIIAKVLNVDEAAVLLAEVSPGRFGGEAGEGSESTCGGGAKGGEGGCEGGGGEGARNASDVMTGSETAATATPRWVSALGSATAAVNVVVIAAVVTSLAETMRAVTTTDPAATESVIEL